MKLTRRNLFKRGAQASALAVVAPAMAAEVLSAGPVAGVAATEPATAIAASTAFIGYNYILTYVGELGNPLGHEITWTSYTS